MGNSTGKQCVVDGELGQRLDDQEQDSLSDVASGREPVAFLKSVSGWLRVGRRRRVRLNWICGAKVAGGATRPAGRSTMSRGPRVGVTLHELSGSREKA